MKTKAQTIIISMTTALFMLVAFSFTQKTSDINAESKGINKHIPIGTIVAWSGNPDLKPTNWLICNGSIVSKDKYRNLYHIIGEYWTKDEGHDKDMFYLPDLQGVFLRGVDRNRNDKYFDPDKYNRKTLYGKISNNVGSFQLDAFQDHTHNIQSTKQSGKANAHTTGGFGGRTGWHPITEPKEYNENGKPRTAKETRPKNAYVYWIIKAK